MFIRILQTTLLQIFCEDLLYFQVIFKSMKIADDTFLGYSECEWVNPLAIVKSIIGPHNDAKETLSLINAHSGQKLLDSFDKISEAKAKKLGKYLKEKCQVEHNQQFSFKYFVKSFLIPKVSSKVLQIQTKISKGTLSNNGLSTNGWEWMGDHKRQVVNSSIYPLAITAFCGG